MIKYKMEKKASDFNLDTDGTCFLCIHRISNTFPDAELMPNSIKASHNNPNHSIQCLSRFIKVDLKKVVIGEEDAQLQSNLLARVKESKLKVGLCEECAAFNDKFSKLFLRLEKMKLEMISMLGDILPKLEKLGGPYNDHIKMEADQPNMTNMQKLFKSKQSEILDGIRTEVKQKCKLKLANNGPRVKLQLSSKKNIDWMVMPKCKINSTEKNNDRNTLPDSSFGEIFRAKIELEDRSSENSPDDDKDYVPANVDFGSENEDGDGPACKSKRPKTAKKGAAKNSRLERKNRYKLPTVDKSESYINPVSGKHTCVRCSREFKQRSPFVVHFRSHHLFIRFICNLCGKGFPQKSSYNRHYQEVHVKLKIPCSLCNKIFSSKNALMVHTRASHFGLRYSCKFCSKTFRSPDGWRRHERTFHAK